VIGKAGIMFRLRDAGLSPPFHLTSLPAVAAKFLVDARRKHFINLFVWPATGTNMFSESSGSRQDYSWMMWRSGEMQFCLVSDASSGDLRELKHLIDR
jgi:hypothetical protein